MLKDIIEKGKCDKGLNLQPEDARQIVFGGLLCFFKEYGRNGETACYEPLYYAASASCYLSQNEMNAVNNIFDLISRLDIDYT